MVANCPSLSYWPHWAIHSVWQYSKPLLRACCGASVVIHCLQTVKTVTQIQTMGANHMNGSTITPTRCQESCPDQLINFTLQSRSGNFHTTVESPHLLKQQLMSRQLWNGMRNHWLQGDLDWFRKLSSTGPGQQGAHGPKHHARQTGQG